MAPSDEELGRRQSVYPPDGPRPSSVYPDELPNSEIETSEKLAEFRMLVGITTHPSFKAPRGFSRDQRPVITTKGRPAPNTGIYCTVVDCEIKSRRNYRFFSRLINGALGLQIIVAAALTALGAAKGSNKAAITVFGAVNTVIAGFLSFIKGSGLPNRLKYFQHEWAKVREYIEQRERDLAISHHGIDIHAEVNLIRRMFEEVRADIETSTPDRFVSVNKINMQAPTAALRMPLSSPRFGGIEERFNSAIGSARNRADAVHKEVTSFEKEVGGTVGAEAHQVVSDVAGLERELEEKMQRIVLLEKMMVSQARKTVEGTENEVAKRADEAARSVERTAERGAQHVENTVDRGAEHVQDRVDETSRSVQRAVDRAADHAQERVDSATARRAEHHVGFGQGEKPDA